MSYTNFTLIALGILGVLLHNLVSLNKINKKSKAGFKLTLMKYLGAEIYSILISILMVVVAAIVKHEIASLEAVGSYLGFGFVAIGYMGQSLLVWIIGRAESKIGMSEEEKQS